MVAIMPVPEESEAREGRVEGRARNYVRVSFPMAERQAGSLIKVQAEYIDGTNLIKRL